VVSGRKDDRPGWFACLKAMQLRNTLMVWKLERLGRGLKYLVGLIDDLNQRGGWLKTGANATPVIANGPLVLISCRIDRV